MADLTAKDAAQIDQLTAAAAAARAEAVAAITGQPVADTAAARRSVGKPQGVSVLGGGEIEPAEAAAAGTKTLAGEGGFCTSAAGGNKDNNTTLVRRAQCSAALNKLCAWHLEALRTDSGHQ